MNIKQKIGLRIKELRSANNLTQEELGALSGLDRTYITSVENGKRNISIVNLEKIANAFNINLRGFFNNGRFNNDSKGIE